MLTGLGESDGSPSGFVGEEEGFVPPRDMLKQDQEWMVTMLSRLISFSNSRSLFRDASRPMDASKTSLIECRSQSQGNLIAMRLARVEFRLNSTIT